MIKAVLIDDDRASLMLVKKIVLDNFKNIYVVGEAFSVSEAVSVINETKPDIVFLDVEMPDGNSFDLLRALDSINFEIIFITTYDQYAIKAIKLSALDYILKPVNKLEIIKAVNKFFSRRTSKSTEIRYNVLKGELHDEEKGKTIILPSTKEFLVVSPNDIVRCQSDSYYSKVYLSDGKVVMVSKTLKQFEHIFDDSKFIRIHNSHLINVKYVVQFINTKESHVVMKGGEILPVSRRKKENILSVFKSSKI
ncbi:MAG: LytTR family DNA-binding domain-containing protein [Bacteroidales bacterium]|nr:LytTR family DNA-binding domain-containing protein [Bacteroidales bacterium]